MFLNSSANQLYHLEMWNKNELAVREKEVKDEVMVVQEKYA